jgi:hypothetical protein
VKSLLCVTFVLDSAFFIFAVGLTCYVSRIVPASERTAGGEAPTLGRRRRRQNRGA